VRSTAQLARNSSKPEKNFYRQACGILNREVVRPWFKKRRRSAQPMPQAWPVKFFSGLKSCGPTGRFDRTWKPHLAEAEREQLYKSEESGHAIV